MPLGAFKSARRGRGWTRARAASVEAPYVGSTAVSSGKRSSSIAMERASVPVAAGQVGAPTEPRRGRRRRRSRRRRVGHVAGAVARGEEHVDVEARELQPSRRPRRSRRRRSPRTVNAGPQDVRVDVGEDRDLDLRAPDLRPRRARDGATAPTWSKCVCVSRIAVIFALEVLGRGEDALGLVAGVDADRLFRRRRAGDEAVLLSRADGEAPDVLIQSLSFPPAFFFGRRPETQSASSSGGCG